MAGLEIVGLVGLFVLLCVAAVLAAAETSLTQLNRAQAEAIDSGDAQDGAHIANLSWILQNRERVLSPIFLLSVASHLGAASIVALLLRDASPWWIAAALFVLLAIFFTFGEALPKGWALHDPVKVARRLTPLIRSLHAVPPMRWMASSLLWFSNLLLPSARLAGLITSDEEFIAFATAAVESEILDPSERELIESVIEFGDTVARAVMTPRTDMVAVARDTTVAEALSLTIESGFSRLPVFRDRADDIVGVVHAKRLAQADRAGRGAMPVVSVARNPLYVPETKTAESLLREMQEKRNLLAIVVDEYGGTAGLVTMEDLVEELVGEIIDEFDREEPLFAIDAAGDVVVHGRMPVDELESLIRRDLPDGDWDTIGGLIFASLGHLPETGEHLNLDAVLLVVEKVEGRRITQVRISVDSPPADPTTKSQRTEASS